MMRTMERERAAEDRSLLQAVVDSSEDAIISKTLDGTVLSWNPGAEALYGYTSGEMIGQSIAVVFPPNRTDELHTILAHVRRGERISQYETVRVRKDGRTVEVAVSISPIRNATGVVTGATVIARDISQRKRTERRLAAQHAVTRLLAATASTAIEQAAPAMLQAICGAIECSVGAAWRVDRSANVLRCVRTWQAPGGHADEFIARSRETTLPPGVGLPGRVWESGEPAWIPDIQEDTNFPRLAAAVPSDLHGALAFPVSVRGELVAVLEFFSRLPQEPDPDLVTTMAAIGGQISQFFERTRAERTARESEARKTAIVVSAMDCIVDIDADGRITEFNPAAEKAFGYRRDDVLGRPLTETIIPPAWRDAHRRGLAHYLATGEGPVIGNRIEVTAMRADGTEFPVELAIVPYPGCGRPAFTGYLRDISDRKQIEAEREERLRQEVARTEAEAARERIADILECVTDGFVALDREWRYTYVNRQAEEILQRTRHDLLGKNVWEEFPEAAGTLFHSEGIRAMETRTPVAYEEYYPAPLWKWLEVRAYPTSEGLAVNFRDITDRKREEAERSELALAVQKEQAILSAVMASMSDGLLVMDANHQIRYVNARAGELLEVEPAALTGKSTEDAFQSVSASFRNVDLVRAQWRRALWRLHELPAFDACLIGPPARDISLQLFPVADAASDGPGVGVMLRDVTAERDLQRTKDELVSVVSHELRTPLASLVGFAELLLIREYDEAQRKQFLGIMLQEGRRLSALIDDFLDLQRMESARQQLSLTPADLRPLLERAVASAGEDPERPIRLAVPEHLPLAQVDPDRVLQVLANLLSNARKYSPRGGEICIAARPVEGAVEIAVQDQGLGIPPDALPQLFQKFFRVDNSDRRAIKGTGLGLALVKQIVEAHGGKVAVESVVGQGSTFTLSFPLSTAAPTMPTPERPPPAVVSDNAYILLVEDDAAFARWIVETLKETGYAVQVCDSGEAAVQTAAQTPPAVVLLDLALAGELDGWDVLAVLRGRVELADVPIAIVSASDERERAHALGVTDYLVKPVDSDVLLRLLQRLVLRPGGTVLVVEDDEAMRYAVVEQLRSAALPATGVRSGEMALDLLRARPTAYGLVLLDLGLPGIDGFGVLEALRARPATRDLPVLVLTGHDLDVPTKCFLAERAVEVLRKSDDRQLLMDVVTRALGEPSTRGPAERSVPERTERER